MWVKLDDEFPGHHKLTIAGRHIGRQATGRALAVFVEGLCWSNKHRTEGFLPADVVGTFQHDRDPFQVAAALVWARFWEPTEGGWRIHNWAKYQLDEARRAAIAQARSDAGKRGAESRWNGRKNGNHSKVMANDSKGMAKNAPVPVPFASKEAKGTVRARTTASAPLSGGSKPKHQPKTDGAWRCPHIPLCPSYGACIKRTLDEANDRS